MLRFSAVTTRTGGFSSGRRPPGPPPGPPGPRPPTAAELAGPRRRRAEVVVPDQARTAGNQQEANEPLPGPETPTRRRLGMREVRLRVACRGHECAQCRLLDCCRMTWSTPAGVAACPAGGRNRHGQSLVTLGHPVERRAGRSRFHTLFTWSPHAGPAVPPRAPIRIVGRRRSRLRQGATLAAPGLRRAVSARRGRCPRRSCRRSPVSSSASAARASPSQHIFQPCGPRPDCCPG